MQSDWCLHRKDYAYVLMTNCLHTKRRESGPCGFQTVRSALFYARLEARVSDDLNARICLLVIAAHLQQGAGKLEISLKKEMRLDSNGFINVNSMLQRKR